MRRATSSNRFNPSSLFTRNSLFSLSNRSRLSRRVSPKRLLRILQPNSRLLQRAAQL